MTADGVWIAYHSDWSQAAVFNEELEARRYAIAKYMDVRFFRWGEEFQ